MSNYALLAGRELWCFGWDVGLGFACFVPILCLLGWELEMCLRGYEGGVYLLRSLQASSSRLISTNAFEFRVEAYDNVKTFGESGTCVFYFLLS